MDVCHFILPVMDTSSLQLELLSIECEVFVAVDQLLCFAVPLSVDTVISHIQVRRNVCAVFAFLFSFV